jgi:AcrR family transcriptional regulator
MMRKLIVARHESYRIIRCVNLFNMRERARSAEDKARRSDDLLAAAEAIALERGGVRYVTVAEVTERVGLHRTGARRYYASKEGLLLELAARGWDQWSTLVQASTAGRDELTPEQVASTLATTITSLPVFCDLLWHVSASLEGEVDIDRARRYKTAAFAAFDRIVRALTSPAGLTAAAAEQLVSATTILSGALWQATHPTATLVTLYEEEPRWTHAGRDFEERLHDLLTALALGLARAPGRIGAKTALDPRG